MENPHGQRSLAGYSPWGHKESDTTEQLSTAQNRIVSRVASSPYNCPPTVSEPWRFGAHLELCYDTELWGSHPVSSWVLKTPAFLT